jgi:hypothetical protein
MTTKPAVPAMPKPLPKPVDITEVKKNATASPSEG